MRLSAAAGLFTAVMSSLLIGCSGTSTFPNVDIAAPSPSSPSGITSAVLKGTIHGGQQPIKNAKIYLLAAGSTGYGSAATSLLTSTSDSGYPSQMDSSGRYYVLTDANGLFQIADTCTPGQQVYVASVGGNPGFGANSAANEIALLGTCPAAGNFDSTLTGVFISEISTVVAAYSAAAYATDTFDIGAPSGALAQTGIANAFANAANLFDVQNMNDLARSTTVNGTGTVPQARLNTIANILASCVNSSGPSSPSCSTLFTYAKAGGMSGATPGDVTTAAINIAHNPSSAGTATLYTLQGTNYPFGPVLASAPGDFTIALDFAKGALGSNPSLAIDGTGDVWSLVPGSTAVAELSPTGELLSGATGYAIGGGFSGSRGLAFDTSNNLWVLGQASLGKGLTATYAELSNAGVYRTTVTQPGTTVIANPVTIGVNAPTSSTNLVLDGAGNFYYSSQYVLELLGTTLSLGNCCTVKYNMASGTVTNLDNNNTTPGTNFIAVSSSAVWATSDGTSVSWTSGTSKSVSGGGLSGSVGVALDSAGDAWMVNSSTSTVSEFSSTGTAISGSSGFGSGLSTPKAIAVDGSGGVWVTNSSGSYSLSPMTAAGAMLGSGYSDANLSSAGALAIDPSGNVWVASSSSSTISEFVGAAAPVVTPMAAAIHGGFVGTRP